MKNNQTFLGLILGGIILIVVSIFIFIIFKNTSKESDIIFKDNSFEVLGQYGEEFLYEDITTIELMESIPNIVAKTNGASLGEFKKGNFTVEGLGQCKLYIHSDSGPYVYIKMNDIYVIINFADKGKTEKLFNDLSEKIAD